MTIKAIDPVSYEGLVSAMRAKPGIDLETGAGAHADVAIVVVDQFESGAAMLLRRTADALGIPIVLVAHDIRESDVMVALECQVVAVVPRRLATRERLFHAVTTAAAGGGVLPPNLLGILLGHIRDLQVGVLAPLGLTGGLTAREADVLRLVADGADTTEIADKLNYSERTVKNILYSLTSRLHLRNRTHAVAYAIRAGII